jgi:hypothetical protein
VAADGPIRVSEVAPARADWRVVDLDRAGDGGGRLGALWGERQTGEGDVQ